MSLVAYNASDESDVEESDEETITGNNGTQNSTTSVTKSNSNHEIGHISDEDEYEAVSSTSSNTYGFSSTFAEMSETGKSKQSLDSEASVSFLKDLPAPLSKTGEKIAEENELEDEVKPKKAELESAPKPPARKKQPVKITIPSLQDTPAEEEDNSKKKITASKTKSGLFSLLPPPVHSSKKEINRPLIPHTLTKKPTTSAKPKTQAPKPTNPSTKPPSSSTAAANRKATLNIAMYGSDSEDEDDSSVSTSNFFSLGSSSHDKVKNSARPDATERLQSEDVSSSDVGVNKNSVTNSGHTTGKAITEISPSFEQPENSGPTISHIDPGPEPGSVNDAPLEFGSRNASQRSWTSLPSYSEVNLGAVGLGGPVTSTNSYSSGSYMPSSSAHYNMVDTQIEESGDHNSEVTDDDLKKFMSDKEFQRLSGKRKRGLEADINFVDANVDDYVDPSELSKHLSEETEYVSHKNKDNMPTAQQRKKKQITYLAYQAKERELELKNTWAQNRMTKQQTQSKYGF